MIKFSIKTSKEKEIVDITDIINDLLLKSNFYEGICILFTTHTTCALTTVDLDPGGTDLDYLDFFQSLIPKLNYRHPHDPSHVPDHIISSLIGPGLAIPVNSANMVLGTWQKVALIELNGPKERQITLTFLGERKNESN